MEKLELVSCLEAVETRLIEAQEFLRGLAKEAPDHRRAAILDAMYATMSARQRIESMIVIIENQD